MQQDLKTSGNLMSRVESELCGRRELNSIGVQAKCERQLWNHVLAGSPFLFQQIRFLKTRNLPNKRLEVGPVACDQPDPTELGFGLSAVEGTIRSSSESETRSATVVDIRPASRDMRSRIIPKLRIRLLDTVPCPEPKAFLTTEAVYRHPHALSQVPETNKRNCRYN
jgi:hypothetical protein